LKSASGRLEALYRSEGEKGLEILGFPCNQFRGQQPGTDEEIQDFCSTTYDATFPVLAKVDVNGEAATPLYDYLWPEAPGDWGPQYGEFYAAINEINPPADPADVKWNFTKFLVDREGRVVKRFEPPVAASQLESEVAAYL
jgi:glutathione peroxidase